MRPSPNQQQEFCHRIQCQNARKRRWRQNKRSRDPDYKINDQASSKAWRRKNPKYWSEYRKTHPEYVLRNRQKQFIRDQLRNRDKCKVDAASLLANSDASHVENLIKHGIYRVIPQNTDLANSDALLVEISVISRL